MNRNAVLCSCGSGARFRACHGGEHAGSARLAALAYAHDLPARFPSLRPRGDGVRLLAERTARGLGENGGHVPASAFEPALELLGPGERQRLVELEEEEMAGNWARVVASAGDDELLRRCLAAGAFVALVSDLRPPPRTHLAQFEEFDDLTRSPSTLLAGVLPPGAVWSVREAERAVREAEGRVGSVWLRTVEEVAYELLGSEHLLRVQRLAAVLGSRLPVPSLPRVSARLRVAVRRLEREDEEAELAAGLLLAAYAVGLERTMLAQSLN